MWIYRSGQIRLPAAVNHLPQRASQWPASHRITVACKNSARHGGQLYNATQVHFYSSEYHYHIIVYFSFNVCMQPRCKTLRCLGRSISSDCMQHANTSNPTQHASTTAPAFTAVAIPKHYSLFLAVDAQRTCLNRK